MKIFFKFYKYILSLSKDMWFIRFVNISLSIVLVVIDSYIVILIGNIIDDVSLGTTTLKEKVIEMIILLSIPFIIEPITFHLKGLNMVTLQKRIILKLFGKVINQDYKYHIDKETGRLMTKLFKSSDIMHLMVWELEYFLFSNVLTFFIPLIFIATISKTLSLIAFSSFIVTLPLLFIVIKLNIKYRTISRDMEYIRNNAIIDGIGNFVTVRAFGKEKKEIAILDEKTTDYRDAELKYQLTWRLVDFISRLSGIFVFITVTFYSIYLFDNKLITLGSVVVIITYMMMFMGRVISLFFSIRNVVKDIPIMKDVLEIKESKPLIVDSENPVTNLDLKGKIELKDLKFSYNDRIQVIEGISLKINPNQTVAFVGPSGGGKTTLTKLIMRYYDPDEGGVFIDDINIKDIKYDNLRDIIGLVPQEPVLFNKTILYNVAYAFKDNTNNEKEKYLEVIEACKKAQIHEFIESLPDGYNTVVGERGLKLSGGQKQRIAIAQVLIKNPKVVIFDEATSQLDSESEKSIQNAFRELSANKTVIIIAHRLSTITHCDNIFVIDGGVVKEIGKHEELLKNTEGIYSSLWKIQSGGFVK